jgi:hypothetical protein
MVLAWKTVPLNSFDNHDAARISRHADGVLSL